MALSRCTPVSLCISCCDVIRREKERCCVELSPSEAAFCFRYSTCSDEGDVAFFDANWDEDGLSVPACISSVISEGAFICGLPDDTGASCCSLAEGAEFFDVPSGIGVFERLE